uniref:Uncharacterized protein n=1 Tax=Romanomermis culicivorax TaxID=13658 RepID=A0A915K7E0_ROMCU
MIQARPAYDRKSLTGAPRIPMFALILLDGFKFLPETGSATASVSPGQHQEPQIRVELKGYLR